MVYNITGKNIRKVRILKKLAQSDVAAALNLEFNLELKQSDISEIERQVRGVKDYELLAFAQVLEVSVDCLFESVTDEQ
jgi:transcriptional regulator with XRE-family HTH domain